MVTIRDIHPADTACDRRRCPRQVRIELRLSERRLAPRMPSGGPRAESRKAKHPRCLRPALRAKFTPHSSEKLRTQVAIMPETGDRCHYNFR